MKKSSKKRAESSKKVASSGKTVKKPEKAKAFALLPISEPDVKAGARVDRVISGQPIPPVTRVRTFSPNDWEDFIQEWTQSLKKDYHTVLRCGGAGDMGRDVVAYTEKPSRGKPWDNYQCKHYDHPLHPGDVWLELGKLVYYTFHGHFTIPRSYFFICPHDVGTSVMRMLEHPDQLRDGLIENWDKRCRIGISKTEDISLSGKLLKYVRQFPFQIVSTIPVLKIIEQHQRTRWHVHRFGGGLPDRPKHDGPPDGVASHEIKYVTELFNAYSDHMGERVGKDNLDSHDKLSQHFLLSRASFYSAEALKTFSRDHLPEDEYGRLQDEIYDGIQETYLDDHDDGYHKVKEVTKAAMRLQITDHPLLPVLELPDRRGICHQLVDFDRLKWVNGNG